MKDIMKAALAGLLLSVPAIAMAVPAKPGVMTMTQTDGTTVQVRLIGDEFAHQYFTPDGYLLVEEGGDFYYGTVDADGIASKTAYRASDTRTAEVSAFLAGIDREQAKERLSQAREQRAQSAPRRNPGLFPESRFPAMGEKNSIVILVEYTDVKMSVENPHEYFENMLNQQGFSEYGGTGSCRDFFIENSMGQFVPTFDLYGPVTLPHNRAYYGGNNWSGDDQNPAQMIKDACDILDGEVDFSKYDYDDDGEIDNVFVFYAGRGEASGGGADTVWPHSWSVYYGAGYNYYDGKLLGRYACSNEWEGSRPDGIGTFVHEFSHVIGLPDLYATSYTGAFTPGSWSAMDYGPYNNDGCTPPAYGAFERYALSWMEPVRITGAMNATLPNVTDNIAGIIYDDSDPDEYFLFENRQQTGWDTYIPGHGMLVWHIDYNESVWSSNKVNNTSSHQYADIEEADGTQSDYSRDGDSFPGASGVTSFTDNTRPSMKRWNGQGFNLPITDIAERGGIITFKVAGGADDFAAPVLAQSDYDFESATITWQNPYSSLISLVINVYKTGESTPLMANVNAGIGPEFTITGLEPETDYTVTGHFMSGLQASAESEPLAVYTGRPGLDRLAVEATAADEIGENSFTAHWNKLPEASDYLFTLYEIVFGAPFTDATGFDDGVTELPEGWTSSSPASYGNSAYSGAAVPALRLGKRGDHLTSAEYADDVRGISFWMRGNAASEGDMVRILYRTAGGSWVELATDEVYTAKGGKTFSYDEFPAGAKAVRIEYARTSSNGAIAIDDVEVRHGMTYGRELVEGFDGIATGDVDSYIVDALKPQTSYSYTVKATDGTLVSRVSNEITVATKPSSGICAPEAPGMTVAVRGLEITVAGAPALQAITVCDIAGRTVASTAADTAGNASLALPAPGIYILRAGTAALKVAVK